MKSEKYTDQFKISIVNLAKSGKNKAEIVQDYGIGKSTIYKWVKEFENSGSFRHRDNLTSQELQLRKQEKELRQLRMENDILKQAALIMGRKEK